MKHVDTTAAQEPAEPAGDRPRGARTPIPAMGTIIGYKLRRAQLAVFQDFLETFSALKLRPAEFSVLALIAEKPGQKQTEVARQLGIKRANFVALMDGLERRGLAERRKDEHDRRSHSLQLTPKGEAFTTDMLERWKAHEDRMVELLGGPQKRDVLIELLDRLLNGSDSSEV